MKRSIILVALGALLCSVGILVSQTVIEQRPLNNNGLTSGMSFGTELPTLANDGRNPFDGEPFIVRTDGSPPALRVYNESTTSWDTSILGEGDIALGDNELDEITANGRIIQNVVRQEFNQSCIIMGTTAFVAESVLDAAVNTVICPSQGPDQGINLFHFRIDGAQASPFIMDGAGALDIDNDGTANEGVEIVVNADPLGTGGVLDVGTSPAKYFQWGWTIASIDGADSYGGGWRIRGAYVDNMVLATIDTGAEFNYTTAAGACNITTQDDGVDATDLITACDLSDAEQMHYRVEVSTAGVFTFYWAATEAALETATAVTKTLAVGAAAAGDQMVPFIWMLQDTAADTEIKLLYVEIGEVQ